MNKILSYLKAFWARLFPKKVTFRVNSKKYLVPLKKAEQFLAAAKLIPTKMAADGGWMPKAWKTLDGPKPEYENKFGMQEDFSHNYANRTYRNVREADATLRIAVNFNSPGEICTYKAIGRYRKPYTDVLITDMRKPQLEVDGVGKLVANWLADKEVEILNVAGNSEQTVPGIERWAYIFLYGVLQILKHRPDSILFPERSPR